MSQIIETFDLTPRFLSFHEQATAVAADPEKRWESWQRNYGFAAVPPTPAGQALARQWLDAAWDRYPAALDRIRTGAASLAPELPRTLGHVTELLECQEKIRLRVILFVGTFTQGAFVAEIEGMPTLALAVEQDPQDLTLILPHELTHIVHSVNAGMALNWERNLASLVLQEGLATRATQALVPGRTAEEYLMELEPGWFAHCHEHEQVILQAVGENLTASDSATLERFTITRGPAGIDRAAYHAGWKVVGELLGSGWSLAKLSKVAAAEVPAVVRAALERLAADGQ
jgi:hypothetical protein